ncbi:hypothetical protein GCM10010305_49080 [Streptomyces termitum]|uniref:Uncharacterized protein n=1 Tax=Streptomyces termitum TaxID=67368 RepID=A0A918T8N2_9ACTN|nr:hypothetical protein GCM10010305_49080 [Streptomyces termitum]
MRTGAGVGARAGASGTDPGAGVCAVVRAVVFIGTTSVTDCDGGIRTACGAVDKRAVHEKSVTHTGE